MVSSVNEEALEAVNDCHVGLVLDNGLIELFRVLTEKYEAFKEVE